MSDFAQTDQNRVRRRPTRGHYDQETIYGIVDAALICHVGFAHEGVPYVIPTLHARRGDEILLHGSSASRLMNHAAAGHPLCITVTHVDGLVLARAVFNHSVNYRSAVLFGRGRLLVDEAEKMAALRDFTERLLPGRWDDVRLPTPTEMKATSIVAVAIDSASAKMRSGPPAMMKRITAVPPGPASCPCLCSTAPSNPIPGWPATSRFPTTCVTSPPATRHRNNVLALRGGN